MCDVGGRETPGQFPHTGQNHTSECEGSCHSTPTYLLFTDALRDRGEDIAATCAESKEKVRTDFLSIFMIQ